MRTSFRPRLINSPFWDPVVYIPFRYQRRALLFDLGDIHALGPRELLKVTHVFITHTHMDHFIGFDALLRVFLGRDSVLHFFGPQGFLRQVEGKLSGYTWNLVEDYAYNLRLKATEVSGGALHTRTYLCRKQFRAAGQEEVSPFSGVLHEEPAFRVEAVLLDHRIPCLGFSLVERFHVTINRDALDRMGLTPGPWLTRFKRALHEERDPGEAFVISWKEEGGVKKERAFPLGKLAARISTITPGQKITYVTDVAGTPENREKILSLADGATQLIIEAPFLARDEAIAREKSHLTAKEAGNLAGKAGVAQMTLCHFSPRYMDGPGEIEEEAEGAFETARSGV